MPHDVVAELYRVFAPYRAGDEFACYPDGSLVEQSNYLSKTPLNQLSADDLSSYAFKAMTTWGDERHFKHFLPRLFEIVLVEGVDNFPVDIEVLFGKLRYADWNYWPSTERKAVEKYVHHFWHAQLINEIRHDYDDTIEQALCALGCAYESVGPFLQLWLELTEPAAVRQLAQFIWGNADRILRKNRLGNAFWEGRPAAAEVLAWIKSDDVATFVQRGAAFFTGHLEYVPSQLEAIRSAAAELPRSDP